MPQAAAPSPLAATRRSATPPDDGTGAGPREDPASGRHRTAPTHTVVFFPPVLGGARPRPGRGLVLDEQWAVTAKFTAGASLDMIGACGGLLCLLDVRSCAVRISNPTTGDSLDLPPPPPGTSTRHDPRAYCLGFDAAAGRHKIVHLPHDHKGGSCAASTGKGVVYVHTVGEKYWRPVRSPDAAACCLPAGGAVYSDGAAYWLTHYKVARARLVRFDLSEEGITSVELPPRHDGHRRSLYCRLMDADATPCVVTSLRRDPTSGEPFPASSSSDDIDMWRLEEDGSSWARPCGLQLRRLPRLLPGPCAVRRGHLLLQREDGALCAHGIRDRGVERIERAGEKVLVEGSCSRRWSGAAKAPPDAAWPCGRGGEIRPARVKTETVAPIMGILALPLYRDRMKKSGDEGFGRRGEKAEDADPARGGRQDAVRTFGFVVPVSAAPLARYLGLGR